jgi:hypothetical protein
MREQRRRLRRRGLGDELAGEGFFEDRLPQGLAPLQRGVDLPLVPFDRLELLVQQAHDFLLFGEGADRDGDTCESFTGKMLDRCSCEMPLEKFRACQE